MDHVQYMADDQIVCRESEYVAFGTFTYCISRAYTAMEKKSVFMLYTFNILIPHIAQTHFKLQ